MTQTFDLDLTHDGVRLRQVHDGEARTLGAVGLDDPDLATRLDTLRRSGETAAQGGFGTVLILPHSEVLFTVVAADAEAPADRSAQVRAELEGLTPYAVDDLVFDWNPVSETEVAVAVVARETLEQAEDFAVAHGFAPRAFATDPKPDLFPARPRFGRTAFAATAAEPDQPAGHHDFVYAETPDRSTATGFHERAAPPPLKVVGETDADWAARPATPPRQAGTASSADAPGAAARRPAPTAPAGPPTGDGRIADIASRIAMLPAGVAGSGADSRRMPAPPTSGPVGPSRPGPGPAPPTPTVHRITPPESAAGADSLTPRPVGTPAPEPSPEVPDPAADPATAERSPGETGAGAVFGARHRDRSGRGSAILPVAVGLAVALLLAFVIWTAFYLVAARDEAGGRAPDTAGLAPVADDAAEPARPDDAARIDGPAPESDAARTGPGAGDPEAALPGGSREATALVAEEPVAPPPASPDPEAAIADPLNRPAGVGEAGRYAATGVDTEAPASPEPPMVERPDDPVAPLEPALRAQDRIAGLSDPEATGGRPSALQLPPPRQGGTGSAAPADTGAAAAEAVPEAPSAAPDAPGPESPDRVMPTPEGALTPEGVRVMSGAPPARPPTAPERAGSSAAPGSEPVVPVTDGPPPVTPPARPGTEASAEPPATGNPSDVASGDPDAASTTGRPAGPLIPATPRTPNAVDARTADDIARISPRPRPAAGITDAGAIDPADTDAAVAAAIPPAPPGATTAPDAIATDPAPGAISPYAVGRSLAPRSRPADLARRVAAAEAAVPPGPATSAPAATRATAGTAMALGGVDLIGVYGSSANRRALVRLPSGRFVKVKVGDPVDGGRVRDISGSALSYVKAGRTLTLNMPSG